MERFIPGLLPPLATRVLYAAESDKFRENTSSVVTEEGGPLPLSTRRHEPSPTRDYRRDYGRDARVVALAAAVEAMSTGHARVLAAELRTLLEDAIGPSAEVVGLDAEARRRGRR